MNCDRAFDLMTSADGQADPALARHLDSCPRCRQMQDTLSPALDWLSGGGVDDWSCDQPATSGTAPLLTAQAVRVAETAARDLSHRGAALPVTLRRALSIAVVLLFGAVLGVAAFDTRRPVADHPPTSSAALLTTCLWNDPALRLRMPDASAQSVVASCVVCHVPQSVR
ncbi:MAG TPA: hypothetical protein VM165_01000 [Planctomycetaceae bacterium]|nr:hypothetical protein [Planctomycetaceae bacterium]